MCPVHSNVPVDDRHERGTKHIRMLGAYSVFGKDVMLHTNVLCAGQCDVVYDLMLDTCDIRTREEKTSKQRA